MSQASAPALNNNHNKTKKQVPLTDLEILSQGYKSQGKESIAHVVDDLSVTQTVVASYLENIKPLIESPGLSKLLKRSVISVITLLLLSVISMTISTALAVTLLLLTATTVLVATYAYGREMRMHVIEPRLLLLVILFTLALAVLSAASLIIN